MTKTLLSAIVAIAATAVVYAGQQGPPAVHAPELIWQSANKNVLVLVPVSGTWIADYEKYDTKLIQVLTIDGAAPAKAPDVVGQFVRKLLANRRAQYGREL